MTPNYQRTDNKKYCVSQLEQSYIHVFRALPQDFTIDICWTLKRKQHENYLSLSLPPVHLILSSKSSSYLFEGGRGKIKWGSTSPLQCKFFICLILYSMNTCFCLNKNKNSNWKQCYKINFVIENTNFDFNDLDPYTVQTIT